MKPKIFIGSSTEGLKVAEKIQENLDYDFECRIWTQDTFKLSSTTIESLEEVLNKSDFAIFVFSPDDTTKIRSKESLTIRDNVVFETGLFIGRLGRKRVFLVMPRGIDNLHLPTDFIGITLGNYDPNRTDLASALGAFCSKVKTQIKEIWLSSSNSDIYSKDILISLIIEFNSKAFRTPFDEEESLTGFERRIKEVQSKVRNKIDQISPTYRNGIIKINEYLSSIIKILNDNNSFSNRYYYGRENSIVIDALRIAIMLRINDINTDLNEPKIKYENIIMDSEIVKLDSRYRKFKNNLPKAILLIQELGHETEIINYYESKINEYI